MNNRKKLLGAGIVKDLWFINREEYEIYLYGMDHRGTAYTVAETYEREDGSFLARIVVEYNGNDLIKLFD